MRNAVRSWESGRVAFPIPRDVGTSGRRQPALDPVDLLRPRLARAAAEVGVEEEVEGLGEVAEAVDAGALDVVGREAVFLRLGEGGARDGEGLGLEGELVLRGVADEDQAGLARELARLEGLEGLGQPG